MDCSFTPSGRWFCFADSGRTVKRGFLTKAQAVAWMWREIVGERKPHG